MLKRCSLLSCSLLLFAGSAGFAADWPSFRGDGTNLARGRSLPLEWKPGTGITWRAELPGYGQSSPVVWGSQVYVTAVEGSQKETIWLTAYNTVSGQVAWKKRWTASQTGNNNPMMSRAAPTPLVDSQGVYALFESGDLFALSHTGETRWQTSLTRESGPFKNNHGYGSSPTQTANAMIVLVDDPGPSYLMALNKQDGKLLWKTERASRGAWSSPVVATVEGRQLILVSSGGTLDAYDAQTGLRLGQTTGLVGNSIPSPMFSSEGFVVVAAGENRMKPDLAASHQSNACFRLILEGDVVRFEKAWSSKNVIAQHASPLIHEGLVYFVSKTGFLHAYDLKSGEERFAERLDNPIWVTPIGVEGHVVCFGKDGVTTVVATGPEFEKTHVNRWWDATEFEKRQETAKKAASQNLLTPPRGQGSGGGAAIPPKELDAIRYSAVGDVVYGVAADQNTWYIRTGTELIAIRNSSSR